MALAVHREVAGPRGERLGERDGRAAVQDTGWLHGAMVHRHPCHQRIVAQLESGQAGLEDAVALWERGEELYRTCVGKLDAAQGKIEELGKRVEEARP